MLKKIRSWIINRRHKKYMDKNEFKMYWGTVYIDEKGNAFTGETDSFGPWTKGEMIDLTGNKEIRNI